MDPEVIKQTVSELQQSSLKVTQKRNKINLFFSILNLVSLKSKTNYSLTYLMLSAVQLFEMAYKKMAADNQSREQGGDSSKKEDQN